MAVFDPKVTNPGSYNRYNLCCSPVNNNAKRRGEAGHPCLIPRCVANDGSSPEAVTIAISPSVIAYQSTWKKGLSTNPMCYNTE